jgi:hypothetical protein
MQTMSSNGARRTGATWVAATGAFLLLAAATVFVAARWDHIPDAVKLAALVAATGACALVGDRLRRTLPATGNALFHLGALLVPIDIAALGLRTHLTWQELLLVDALASTAILALCAHRARSVVLAAAASGGVIASAGGIAAVTGLPAPFVLAAIAAAACLDRRFERHAFCWAGAAAIAPLAVVALDRAITGHGVADELGLLRVAWPFSLATVALVSFVVVRGAKLRDEPALALIGVVAAVANTVAIWHGTQVPHVVDVIAAPSVFLLVEVTVLALRRDPFWARPTHVAGQLVEAVAAVPALLTLPTAFVLVAFEHTWTDVTLAAAIVTVAWIVADARRPKPAAWIAAAAACNALLALAAASGSSVTVATGALAIGIATVMSTRRQDATALAYGAALYAALVGVVDTRFTLTIACVSVGVIACAAWRAPQDAAVLRGVGVVAGFAALRVGEVYGARAAGPVAATLVWPLGAWALALVADRIDTTAANLTRAAAFAVLPFLLHGRAVDAIPACLVLTMLATFDAMRLARPSLAYAAVVPAIAGEIAILATLGLDLAGGGLALCIGASVWLAAAALVRDPWRGPLAACAAACVVIGLGAASNDATAFGPALLVTGALVFSTGLVLDEDAVAHIGAGCSTVGFWIVLGTQHVMISEFYVAPVAVHLLIAGAIVRANTTGERRPSSWIASGPAIALLAGSAIAERIAGGSAWHSVFAGAVGVAAVAVGGWRRSAAPLLLGTATLIAVVLRETLDGSAGVPTWAWLAAGGSALIAAAIAMERTDVSPIEAGRRVVDVLSANFD